MSILKIDRSVWEIMVDHNAPGRFRVGTYTGPHGTARIIATDLSLAVAAQIVDEHIVTGRLVAAFDERLSSTLSLPTGEVFEREPL